MCITVAVASPGGSVIASDRRWTMFSATRKRLAFTDSGGKLVRLRGGWLTFTGRGASGLIAAALGSFAAVDDIDAARLEAALRRAADDERPPDGAECHITLTSDDGTRVARASWNGSPSLTFGAYALSSPLGASEHGRLSTAFRAALQCARTNGDVVRAVARVCAECAELTPLVSPMIEVGVGSLYACAPSGEIGSATDTDIAALLQPAPNQIHAPAALNAWPRESSWRPTPERRATGTAPQALTAHGVRGGA